MVKHYDEPKLTRRRALAAGGATFSVLAAPGCDALSTTPQHAENGTKGSGKKRQRHQSKGGESPTLAARVRSGDLPAVHKRLPDEPLTIKPTNAIGVYGGEWRTALLGSQDSSWIYRTIGYEQLVSWRSDFTGVIPNIADSVDVAKGGREYTFRLRKGIRWSDGQPLTADDLVFTYEDVLANSDVDSVAVPSFLMVDGEPPKVDRVDKFAVRFRFAGPFGLFLEQMASEGARYMILPRHYLKRFSPKYNSEATALAQKEGFDTWKDLFAAKVDQWGGNPDLPTLHPWRLTTAYGAKTTRVVAERNPYYWKTDSEGSQLPYLDSVTYSLVSDPQAIVLKIAHGDIDMHTRHVMTLQNKPVLARNRNKGGYRFLQLIPGSMNYLIVCLNLVHKNPVKREIFQNRDFRVGLSHAINREELIAAVYQKQGMPWQVCPRKESGLYDERLATQYTKFDVNLANELLDRAGYTDRDEAGYRLGPDKRRISFSVEVSLGYDPAWIDGMQLIKKYWKAVGVDIDVKSEERSLFITRKEANEHDAAVWQGNQGALQDAVLAPLWYFPSSVTDQAYAVPWANWFTGESGPKEEPPEPTRQQMELYHELKAATSKDKQTSLFEEILRISQEQFYCMGIGLPKSAYGIVKDDLNNVYEPMPHLWVYPTPGPSRPEQYSFGKREPGS